MGPHGPDCPPLRLMVTSKWDDIVAFGFQLASLFPIQRLHKLMYLGCLFEIRGARA